jgi:hypothetical protein
MEMRHIMKKFWYLAGAAMLLAACPLMATPPTVTFTMTGVGSGANLGGVYTSPYVGNVNGGPTIPIICDDFADDSYVPERWTAYQTQLSDILAGTADTSVLKWGSGWNGTGPMSPQELTQSQAYSAAAILAVDILTSTGLTQEQYSFAMWELFDPSGASAALPATYQPTVKGFVQTAVSEATGGNLSAYLNSASVTIYSYDTGAVCGAQFNQPCISIPPQEFITVSMAEPPSPILLGFDLLAVGGLIFISRRRWTRSVV